MTETEHEAALDELAKNMRDKYTMKKPCLVNDDGTPDAHTVWLVVGVQSFCLDGYMDTAEEADWMRLMLGKALAGVKWP